MNKKFFVFILVVFFVFTKVSAQTNDGYELALTAFSASASRIQQLRIVYSIVLSRQCGQQEALAS